MVKMVIIIVIIIVIMVVIMMAMMMMTMKMMMTMTVMVVVVILTRSWTLATPFRSEIEHRNYSKYLKAHFLQHINFCTYVRLLYDNKSEFFIILISFVIRTATERIGHWPTKKQQRIVTVTSELSSSPSNKCTTALCLFSWKIRFIIPDE